LTAEEFATCPRNGGNRREFLLNFCQDEFGVSDEVSESEQHSQDKAALSAKYKSSFQAAMRKKIL
jgi:hypothetical protein